MPKIKLLLEWSNYIDYTFDNVQKYAPNNSGVYKISIVQNDGSLKVRYVGQTNDLDKRLKEHLDFDNEPNECLREKLEKYNSKFSFAKLDGQKNRDGAEFVLYNHYKPECNDPDAIPNEPDVEINYR